MKIWAKCIHHNKIHKDVVQEFTLARPSDITGWYEVLTPICKVLDIARPLMLSKHLRELAQFSRTTFYEGDFMETIDFDKFLMEILPEEKKRNRM